MPTEHSFWEFGTVLVTVSMPFFLLIGSLNTTKGYEFWKARCKEVIRTSVWFLAFMSGLAPKSSRPVRGQAPEGEDEKDNKSQRSYSRRQSASSDARIPPLRSPASTDMEKDETIDGSEDGGRRKQKWFRPKLLKKMSRRNEKEGGEPQIQEV